MAYIIILLLLYTQNVFPMSIPTEPLTTCRGINWKEPTERENGEPLPKDEIAYYILYMDGKPYKANGQDVTHFKAGTTRARWFSTGECPKCVTGKTVDTEGRVSRMSECLKN